MSDKICTLPSKEKKQANTIRFIFYALFFFLLTTGIVLRLLAIKYEDTVSRDSIDYINLSKRIIQENDFSLIYNDEKAQRHPPLIYLVMYLFRYSETGYLLKAMQTLVFILGILTPIVLYCIAFIKTQSKEAALAVMAIAEVHPFLIRMSYEVLRDPFFIFFASLFFLFFVLMSKKDQSTSLKCVYAFLCGISGMLAFLSRIEGLELLGVYLLYLAYKTVQLYWSSPKNKQKDFLFISWGSVSFMAGYVGVFIFINIIFGINFHFYPNMLSPRIGYHVSRLSDTF